jgi:hypothetical protein
VDANAVDADVLRIALYPDPLLAQVLAAMPHADDIAHASQWADQHRALSGEALAEAMETARLPWDMRVQALLPFPQILKMLSADTAWATRLGQAFAARPREVLERVQRCRAAAISRGLLRTNADLVIESGPPIAIMPADPGVIAVPAYSRAAGRDLPLRVETRVSIGGFRPFGWDLGKYESVGGYFRNWGWGSAGIDWPNGSVIFDNAPSAPNG